MSGLDAAIYDLIQETDVRDWTEINGPDSGLGVDYWFESPSTNMIVNINNDQGVFSRIIYPDPCDEDCF
jgi:hypothetical protein